MRTTPPPRAGETPANDNCLVNTATAAFVAEPALEAIKINRAENSISVATLGRANNAELESFLASRIQQIQQSTAEPHCALLEGQADCSGCALAETLGQNKNFTIAQDAHSTTIARVTCLTAPRFWRWSNFALPKIVPREVHLPEEEDHEHEWKHQLIAAALCGAFGLAGYFLAPGTPGLVAYALAYGFGSWFTLHEVWERLRERAIDVHFLMLAVAAGSASIGAWGEGSMLLFLFSLSGALEHYAMGRTHREIRSLFKASPKTATVLDDSGREIETKVELLQRGAKLLLKPGAQFPVDAEITRGKTAADESTLTGEATPVSKDVGDTLLAGTMNLWGAVEAVVLRPVSQSALQKIIQLIKEAQHQKAPAQRFTDKFGTGYTYGILALTVVMFLVWWRGFGYAPFVSTEAGRSAFYRAMTLLVVASPCALVLSIPSAVLAAIAWGARRGVLFRGGAAVEKLAEVDVVALDKTGTLTTGELQVDRVESFPPGRENEIARSAYSLEKLSTHPLARAITRYGKQQNLVGLEFDHFESIPGLGLKAGHGGQTIWLGRRSWLATSLPAGVVARVPATPAGISEVWLADGDLCGRILLRDDIRPQAAAVIAALRAAKLRTVVLTGDHRAAAETLRQQLHLDDVRAELKPEQKVEAIQQLTREGRRVAMIGDGVNDAPSLAAAHVGVAMGARGADAALEQADLVLMHDRLENFLAAFQLSQRARRVIRQNLVISLGTVVALAGCALLGVIPLTLGVVGHEGSTVIVVMNSLRLLLNKDNFFRQSNG